MRITPVPNVYPAQPQPNPKTTYKLFNSEGGEVKIGDVVRFNNRPCYVERIAELVTIVAMDERKYTFNVQPHQINCVLQKGVPNE